MTVPANTVAIVMVFCSAQDAITEDGQPIATSGGVRALRREGNYAVFAVEAGNYNFVCSATGAR